MNLLQYIFPRFKQNRILILTSGNVAKLNDFKVSAKELGIDFKTASFSDINFLVGSGGKVIVKVGDTGLNDFGTIYFRVVGKSFEQASLIANYAKENRIRLVDELYQKSLLLPLSLSKSLELKKLWDFNYPVPPTIFGSLNYIKKAAPNHIGYPFVVKSTTGKKAREVWLIKNNREMVNLIKELEKNTYNKTSIFFAQKLIEATQRLRVLVVGGKVVGAITRPTKWRRLWETREEKWLKEVVNPIPNDVSELAVGVSKATNLDICGVDILIEDKTQKMWVIEANAAPAWKLINTNCNVSVEKEILKFLVK